MPSPPLMYQRIYSFIFIGNGIKEYILLSLLEMVVCIIDHLVSCHILVTTKTEMLHYYLIIALMKRVMGH